MTDCVSILLCRLCDVVHSEKKLTLVFEYSDQDLKKYFDSCNGEIDPDIVKVSNNAESTFPLTFSRKTVFTHYSFIHDFILPAAKLSGSSVI